MARSKARSDRRRGAANESVVTLWLLAAAALAGCGGEEAMSGGPPSRLVSYDNSPDSGPSVIELRGVRVTVDFAVKDALSVHSVQSSTTVLVGMDGLPPLEPGEDPACRVWLGGRSVVVIDGRFRIGERDYGPVSAGDEVLVDAAGIHVEGELRGALPPR